MAHEIPLGWLKLRIQFPYLYTCKHVTIIKEGHESNGSGMGHGWSWTGEGWE